MLVRALERAVQLFIFEAEALERLVADELRENFLEVALERLKSGGRELRLHVLRHTARLGRRRGVVALIDLL